MAPEVTPRSILHAIPSRHKAERAEVKWGFQELAKFRKGENVIGRDSFFSIIHGQIASQAKLALERGEKEFEDWKISTSDTPEGGILITHTDYSQIRRW